MCHIDQRDIDGNEATISMLIAHDCKRSMGRDGEDYERWAAEFMKQHLENEGYEPGEGKIVIEARDHDEYGAADRATMRIFVTPVEPADSISSETMQQVRDAAVMSPGIYAHRIVSWASSDASVEPPTMRLFGDGGIEIDF